MNHCAAANLDELRDTVARYYSKKVEMHGATALGVDWPCVPSQELRFIQLLKVCVFNKPLSINDFGCGYGALLDFMRKRFRGVSIDYVGIDLSPAMILQAKSRRRPLLRPQFIVGHQSPRTADYSIASGIFNVKLAQPKERWEYHIAQTLVDIFATSRIGFAVNFLGPPHPDAEPIAELYRVPPEVWATFCEREFGANVELVQNYGMQEFTLLARRNHQPQYQCGIVD